MRPATLGLTLALVLGASALDAQLPHPSAPSTRPAWSAVRVAKWVLLGAAVGFGTYALSRSRAADETYATLRAHCDREPERCRLVGGRYADPELERLYGAAAALDRRAQVGILGGQVTLLGSAGLFIYDLRNGRGPEDIPYSPRGSALRGNLMVGARLAF